MPDRFFSMEEHDDITRINGGNIRPVLSVDCVTRVCLRCCERDRGIECNPRNTRYVTDSSFTARGSSHVRLVYRDAITHVKSHECVRICCQSRKVANMSRLFLANLRNASDILSLSVAEELYALKKEKKKLYVLMFFLSIASFFFLVITR